MGSNIYALRAFKCLPDSGGTKNPVGGRVKPFARAVEVYYLVRLPLREREGDSWRERFQYFSVRE